MGKKKEPRKKMDPAFETAYRHLKLAKRAIGFKSLSFLFLKFQDNEVERNGYKLKHINID